MAFDSIPTSLVLKMFEHLPFKDRIRLGGVNQLFSEVSWRSINKMRSLDINDDLINYAKTIQPFSSLLESCSPFLESIKVTSRSCDMSLLSALTEFVCPKLERLEITVTDNEITKRFISRNRNLRSVVLRLDSEFEWPEDIVMEELEKLEICSCKESNENMSYVNLSPTIRPLIGKVPKLGRLTIDRESQSAPFTLSVRELYQMLAAAPCLEKLHMNLYDDSPNSVNVLMGLDFYGALPTWRLPKLTHLVIVLKFPITSTVLQHFTTSSPQLVTFGIGVIVGIGDQFLTALSNLKQLRRLGLVGLGMTKEKFSQMTTLLPSLTMLEIKKIDREGLVDLPRLQHLRAFSMCGMEMTKDEIIDVITNLPSLSKVGIRTISDACSHQSFTDFLTSTGAIFQRNLEIQLYSMRVDGNESELGQMKAILEEIQKNGGPVVEMDGRDVRKISYKSLA